MSTASDPPRGTAIEQAPPAGRGPTRWPRVVSSFESANFRWLMASIVAGTTANWMEIVVRSLIVYQLSDSALAIGIVNSSKSAPMLLFGFVGGVLADRVDRRLLLSTTQVFSGSIALTLAVLVLTGNIEVWHFFVAAFFEGIAGALQQPARQALVPSVVPREHLMNAVTLSQSTWNVSRMVGPALAGAAAGLGGPAAALFLESGLYGVGALAIARTRIRPRLTDAPGGPSPVGAPWRGGRPARQRVRWVDSFRGYGYLRENPVIGWLVVLALVPILFSFAHQALAPVFATTVLGMGAGGVGILLAAPGVGSVAATVLVASAGELPRRGLFVLGGVVLLGFATMLYGFSTWVWLSLAALALHGFAMTAFRSVNQTLAQLNTPDEYRGRVMAVYAADRGLHPVSTLGVTFMADVWGASLAVGVMGAGCVLVALGVGAVSRTLRSID
ncbi:MAG: MFS transporter [Chloroflexi bacterium]|nr:MFS transporter [Chloroflexota bacterium]